MADATPLCDAQGVPAATPSDVAKIWRDRFIREFAGNVALASPESVSEAVDAVRGATVDPAPVPELPSDIISKLTWAAAACKAGRATGPDQIPMEFVQAGGDQYARFLSQVLAHAPSQGIPLAHRGGRMAPVPHKPRQPLSLENSRGILCADTSAKTSDTDVDSAVEGHQPLRLHWAKRP